MKRFPLYLNFLTNVNKHIKSIERFIKLSIIKILLYTKVHMYSFHTFYLLIFISIILTIRIHSKRNALLYSFMKQKYIIQNFYMIRLSIDEMWSHIILEQRILFFIVSNPISCSHEFRKQLFAAHNEYTRAVRAVDFPCGFLQHN